MPWRDPSGTKRHLCPSWPLNRTAGRDGDRESMALSSSLSVLILRVLRIQWLAAEMLGSGPNVEVCRGLQIMTLNLHFPQSQSSCPA